jgi:MFS family permease
VGVGAGIGIVLSGVIVEHLSYHWLFWLPLAAEIVAAWATWRYIPESPVRVPGRINWLAAATMTIGMSAVLLAISETTTWGWASAKTFGLLAFGLAFSAVWIAVDVRSENPLIGMTMMRIRGVWTTNTAAFLLGAGMYASFIVFPQFAQLPRSTGFGFGASVVVSGLYLVPSTVGMTLLGMYAGRISQRFGSRAALMVGTGFTTASFALLARPRPPLRPAGRRRAAGRGHRPRVRGARQPDRAGGAEHQTGVASGMNTVMRTLGGALGGQLSATFIAAHTAHGEPTVTGFTQTFLMATGFLVVCLLASALVPRQQRQPVIVQGGHDELAAGNADAAAASATAG